jgi:hypothetical protein
VSENNQIIVLQLVAAREWASHTPDSICVSHAGSLQLGSYGSGLQNMDRHVNGTNADRTKQTHRQTGSSALLLKQDTSITNNSHARHCQVIVPSEVVCPLATAHEIKCKQCTQHTAQQDRYVLSGLPARQEEVEQGTLLEAHIIHSE